MALYRENGVSPTGGCLPMFMQFPVFIVLYNTIRGMTRTTTNRAKQKLSSRIRSSSARRPACTGLAEQPRQDERLRSEPGGFGALPSGTFFDVIPYFLVILIAVALQYVSIWQITNRNPSAGANQQMQQIQKFMPLIFVFIYIEFPAGVGLVLHRVECVPNRPAGVDVQAGPTHPRVDAEAEGDEGEEPDAGRASLRKASRHAWRRSLRERIRPSSHPKRHLAPIRKPPQGQRPRQGQQGQRPAGTEHLRGQEAARLGARARVLHPAKRPGQVARPARSGQKRPPGD